MNEFAICACPMCGSKRIRRVKRLIVSNRGGEVFVARGIEVEECPDCGERLQPGGPRSPTIEHVSESQAQGFGV